MNAINHPRGMLRVRAETDVAAAVAKALADFNAGFTAHRERTDAEIHALKATIADLEQRGPGASLTAMPGGGTALATMLAKSDAFAAVAGKRQTKSAVEVTSNMLLGVSANSITYDGGAPSVVERQPGIVSGMARKRWLRQRLVTVPTAGGSVEFTRELLFTNNAQPQGGGSPFQFEGVAKAESVITYEQVEKKASTVAHFIKASKQILSDVPMLQATLDNRLRYGLELATEAQIIAGTGVGANMSGLTTAGNHTAFTPTSGDTAIDSINRALAALETAEAAPDIVLMHPVDYRAMQRVKNGVNGDYVFGSPSGANGASVWNTEIYTTPAMTQGYFVAADLAQMGVLFLREDAQVAVGWVGDDFTSNLVTILAELRAVVAVQRPAAVQYGALTL